MQPGREVDTLIAQHIFGFEVKAEESGPTEITPHGVRPLRYYSQDMSCAWGVADKLNMALIPVEGRQWFAIVGRAWATPADFMAYLQEGKFTEGGAAVGDNAPLTICLAALRAIEKELLQDIADRDLGTDKVAAVLGVPNGQNLN